MSRKRANDLDGKSWLRNSISIWNDIRKTPEEVALKHPALFPQALVERLLDCFTNESQDRILDPFAGVGSTLLAAKARGKVGIGTELYPEFARIAEERCAAAAGSGQTIIHNSSALNLLQFIEPESIDFVVTSPPYWDILKQPRSADYKEIRHYGEAAADLGQIKEYHQFLEQLQKVFVPVYQALRPKAYCCVIVMDIRKKNRFYPFHSDLATKLQEIGFLYDDLIIWDRRHEYNNMRPLGYPYVFRINKAHEFILIFQKP